MKPSTKYEVLWPTLLICITLLALPILAQTATEKENLRECECWSWPKCVSNCTANPLLGSVLQTDHQFLSTLRTPFVLVFPYQIRKNKPRYETSTQSKWGSYFQSTKFWLNLVGREHIQLRLEKSKIFGQDQEYSTLYFRKWNGQIREVESDKIKRCHYVGQIKTSARKADDVTLLSRSKREKDSFVAVDTCNGLRGILSYRSSIYGVAPLTCASCTGILPHVVFPEVEDVIDRDVKLNTFWRPNNLLGSVDMKQISESSTYSFRVGLVIDNSLFKTFGSNIDDTIQYGVRIMNLAAKAFASTQVKLRLVHTEVWNLQDRITIEPSIKATLNAFARYRRLSAPRENTNGGVGAGGGGAQAGTPAGKSRLDGTIFLTQQLFTEAVEYLAVPDSVCTVRSIAVVQVTRPAAVYNVSRLVALAVAEEFGIKAFPCPDLLPCDTKNILSKGDISRLSLTLLSGLANCLLDKKPAETALRTPWTPLVDTCGNGKIDRGEECDPRSASSSPCCDQKTCLTATWTQCVDGECCTNCSLLPRGRICRPARDECDLPEFCTGVMGSCSPDIYLENGRSCRSGAALCYQGRCPTRDAQCRALWGGESKSSHPDCYMTYNHNQGAKSSCGRKKCKKADVMCGVLNCEKGSDKLIESVATDETSNHFINTIVRDDKKIQCKSLAESSDRYVHEGTQCAPDKFCFDNQCISLVSPIRSNCPVGADQNTTCSNRGLCTNHGKCLCQPEWSGSYCEMPANSTVDVITKYIWLYVQAVRDNIGRDSSADVNRDLKTGEAALTTFYLIIILVVVIGVVFIPVIIFIICYSRRQSANRQSARRGRKNIGQRVLYTGPKGGTPLSNPVFLSNNLFKVRAEEEEENMMVDSMDRIIKFGSMPSYREDKLNKIQSTTAPSIVSESSSLPSGQNSLIQLPSSFTCGQGRDPGGLHVSPTTTICNSIDTTNCLDVMAMPQGNMLMENSWRQPEKGILKNKNVDELQDAVVTSAVEKRRASNTMEKPSRDSRKLCSRDPRSSQSSLSSCGSSMASTKRETPPPAPTILCNAANQTEVSTAQGRGHGNSHHSQALHTPNEDDPGAHSCCGEGCTCDGDETDFECDQPDCLECRRNSASPGLVQHQDPVVLGGGAAAGGRCGPLFRESPNLMMPKTIKDSPSDPTSSGSNNSNSRPNNNGVPHINGGCDGNSEDGVMGGQNSETEVDAHFLGSSAGSVVSSQSRGRGPVPSSSHSGSGNLNRPPYESMMSGPSPASSLPSNNSSTGRPPRGPPGLAYPTGASSSPPPLPQAHNNPHLLTNGGVLLPKQHPVQHNHNNMHYPMRNGIEDDLQSEVSISAFRRGEAMEFGPDDRLSEVRSNEGTWEGSDTSSLPDTCADIMHMAKLAEGVRPGVGHYDYVHYHPAPPIPPHYRHHNPGQLPAPPLGFGGNYSVPQHQANVISQPQQQPMRNGSGVALRHNNIQPIGSGTTMTDNGDDSDEPSLRRKSYSRATDSYENLLSQAQ